MLENIFKSFFKSLIYAECRKMNYKNTIQKTYKNKQYLTKIIKKYNYNLLEIFLIKLIPSHNPCI